VMFNLSAGILDLVKRWMPIGAYRR
jgi:hypothetical protein